MFLFLAKKRFLLSFAAVWNASPSLAVCVFDRFTGTVVAAVAVHQMACFARPGVELCAANYFSSRQLRSKASRSSSHSCRPSFRANGSQSRPSENFSAYQGEHFFQNTFYTANTSRAA